MNYHPANNRYESMTYKRCGNSGIQLPLISIGLWHNFGQLDPLANCKNIIHTAFDHGITHFDLANNYGPPPGAAEETFGKIMKDDLAAYRDEMIISTKAGYGMWPGPYGDWGSKKYLVASMDKSLQRMGLDYVDIFYHHRPDPNTPIEETMGALDTIVRQGKALYAGISNYNASETETAIKTLQSLGTPCLIHQEKYSMLVRQAEEGLFDALQQAGVGCIAFSPLAQGLLTNKYVNDIPVNSRIGRALPNGAITEEALTRELKAKINLLNKLAQQRHQTLAQMALAWVLRQPVVTSAILGVSNASQLTDAMKALQNLHFSAEELKEIDSILAN